MCKWPFFYGPAVPGAIAPVNATDDMTQPVGIRNCRLYTKPGDAVVTEFENRLEAVESASADYAEDIGELQEDVNDLAVDVQDVGVDISSLDTRVTALENAPSSGGGNAYTVVASQFSIAEVGGQIVLSLTYDTPDVTPIIDTVDIVVLLGSALVQRAFTLYNANNGQFVLSENGSNNGRVVFSISTGSSGGITITTLTETNNTLWSTNLSTSDMPIRAVIHYHV